MQDGIVIFKAIENFCMSVLNGVLVSICAAILYKIFNKIINYILVRNAQFNLNGIWINRHTNFAEEDIIELVWIVQKKNNEIKIRIDQYKKGMIRKFAGCGIIKANKISLYYYAIDKQSTQTGTMALEIEDDGKGEMWLQGVYFEISKAENIQSGSFPHNYYQLKRLKMSKSEMLLYVLKKKYFASFQSLCKYLKEKENG